MKSIRFCRRSQWTIALTIMAVVTILSAACAAPSTASLPEPENNAPVIHYLTTQKQVSPSSSSHFLCVATDKDSDVLNYQWASSGGQIQGEGNSITWIAPDVGGDYTITVVVSDGKGNEVTSSATVAVTSAPPQHPVIDSMTCADCSNGIQASRWSQYLIECNASDPNRDELQYTWIADIGKIEGEGSTVTWRTFGQYGNALIKVIVSDDQGNETEGYLAINISCCH